ncbi:MAG: ABC transporter ATP-binding protein [Gammaproteobacteria bacterium]|nr:ABC transporter ATP-binding protein [Gammaproteobacteria bacterium]
MLNVEQLTIQYPTTDGLITVVDTVSFNLSKGETLGIVGESGSGKSQLMLALMGLLTPQARVSGHIELSKQRLMELNAAQRAGLNGNHIAMIFQDPMSSLNPYLSIATQMTEVLTTHQKLNNKLALQQSIAMLDRCGIRDADTRIHAYPHEFSGGMRQRILIAMSVLCQPDVLIADEPTTALDVTLQAQIINLLKDLQQQYGMSLLIVTHDFGVVSELCDRVMVMYGGQVMESGAAEQLLSDPMHPYTTGLLASMPGNNQSGGELYSMPGDPVDPASLPAGCPFQPRCQQAIERCRITRPVQNVRSGQRLVNCHVVP